ncbi:coiled-coil domain-containing protein 89 [Etheostoma cragini]|uniref:coiled-coil domain-containing protein 89 n=1 Tax=Etheostoma cragini TaxID=417921 RepID=UPI00155EE95D|nr:coiled-coil domain-containing protein 89 [Etheostoma cragini]XP_034741438.1 coiled-coil domain-containing protein 89 [Etheostoma cragini]
MATPQRNAENFMKVEGNTTLHMEIVRESLEKLRSISANDATETGMLRSRIDEQSSLICMLKERADEVLLRCQALQNINMELESRVTDCQTELDSERKRAELLEKRFVDLAANNQAIIAFMEEYKSQNVQLKLENKQLQSENDTLFSQKLQDKEVFVQKQMQEIKQLKEKYTNKEIEYEEKLAGCQSKLLKQTAQHQSRCTSLLDQLHDAQQQQRDAVEMCNALKLNLQNAEEELAFKETKMRESTTSLTIEKDKLLFLSIERGKVIQEKQEEIQQLETKWKEEKKARTEAEDRFEQEAKTVNADVKVKSLQSALNESMTKYEKLKKDFKAFQEHSTNLLLQERELNKKLRHMLS